MHLLSLSIQQKEKQACLICSKVVGNQEGGKKLTKPPPTASNLKLGVFFSLPTLEAAGDNVLVLTESMQRWACREESSSTSAQNPSQPMNSAFLSHRPWEKCFGNILDPPQLCSSAPSEHGTKCLPSSADYFVDGQKNSAITHIVHFSMK